MTTLGGAGCKWRKAARGRPLRDVGESPSENYGFGAAGGAAGGGLSPVVSTFLVVVSVVLSGVVSTFFSTVEVVSPSGVVTVFSTFVPSLAAGWQPMAAVPITQATVNNKSFFIAESPGKRRQMRAKRPP
jgi:hypothetical protein